MLRKLGVEVPSRAGEPPLSVRVRSIADEERAEVVEGDAAR